MRDRTREAKLFVQGLLFAIWLPMGGLFALATGRWDTFSAAIDRGLAGMKDVGNARIHKIRLARHRQKQIFDEVALLGVRSDRIHARAPGIWSTFPQPIARLMIDDLNDQLRQMRQDRLLLQHEFNALNTQVDCILAEEEAEVGDLLRGIHLVEQALHDPWSI